MDSASMAAFTNIGLQTTLATPANQRATLPIGSTLISPWPSMKPTIFALHRPTSNPRNTLLSVTRCSTKPDTNKDDVKDLNSTTKPDSNALKPPIPISNQALPSPLNPSSPPPPSSRGLVFDLGLKESWDGAEIGSPVVKRFLSDEEERWYMWYNGKSEEIPNADWDSIGLAVSSNGVHWERGKGPVQSSQDTGLVMKCSKDWWAFDTLSIRPSEVVIMSSSKVRASSAVYWLYYCGFSSEIADFSDFSLDGSNGGKCKMFNSLPGLAISQDGRHWARIEGEHHSGALFEVGSEGDWDSLFISGPQVVFHSKGDLRMYYHSFDLKNKEFCIGMARSRDGIKWVKLGKILGGGKGGSFYENGVLNANVVRNRGDGTYLMAYEGVAGDGRRSVGMAVSQDGLKDWRRFGEEAVLKPSEKDGWDCEGVESPCLVQMEGEEDEWRLYYTGFGNGGRTGIGLAVSDKNDIRSFRRWSGFHF